MIPRDKNGNKAYPPNVEPGSWRAAWWDFQITWCAIIGSVAGLFVYIVLPVWVIFKLLRFFK
jgi:hypothetical protein